MRGFQHRLRSVPRRATCQKHSSSKCSYASKAQFDWLVAYVQEFVEDHNAHEQCAIEIERREEARRKRFNPNRKTEQQVIDAKRQRGNFRLRMFD